MAREAPINPADLFDMEKANIRIVHDFISSWIDPFNWNYSLLAEDGEFRSHDTVKKRMNKAELKEYVEGGTLGDNDWVEIIFHETFAKGTMVASSRTDIVHSPGKNDRIFEIVSDLTVKKGKIVEWTDHVYAWSEGPMHQGGKSARMAQGK